MAYISWDRDTICLDKCSWFEAGIQTIIPVESYVLSAHGVDG